MARIDGRRIIPDSRSTETIDGWAILVHGRTKPDLLFVSRRHAEDAAVFQHLVGCEIVPVKVSGIYVERTEPIG